MATAGEFHEFCSIKIQGYTSHTKKQKTSVKCHTWPTCCVTTPGVARHAVVIEFDLREQRCITHDSPVSGGRVFIKRLLLPSYIGEGKRILTKFNNCQSLI